MSIQNKIMFHTNKWSLRAMTKRLPGLETAPLNEVQSFRSELVRHINQMNNYYQLKPLTEKESNDFIKLIHRFDDLHDQVDSIIDKKRVATGPEKETYES